MDVTRKPSGSPKDSERYRAEAGRREEEENAGGEAAGTEKELMEEEPN